MTLPSCLTERSFRSHDAANQALAKTVARRLHVAVEQRGQAGMIVPGGQSPRGFFKFLCQYDLPWSKIIITLTDERMVSPENNESNLNQLRELLLQGPARAARVIPLVEAVCDPHTASAQACERLQGFPWPADVTLVGFGQEGHIASLFPGNRQLSQPPCGNRCIATRSPEAPRARISLTPQSLLDSRWVGIMIPNAAKHSRFENAKAEGCPCELPLRTLLHQDHVPVTAWISTQEAA
uniref:6-phosphogluconolactonase n=1 Tax=Magnetococcus massalia (strain MO-1) TaxID=451514 RepID=A0A1S7LM96_MAGMO|nr:putative 6-phosphogluconolactonase [Candidatus Magnetococcus massalia]